MKLQALGEHIRQGGLGGVFARLYGEGRQQAMAARYLRAVQGLQELRGAEGEASLYSAPGRTEIMGNHTDHNNGLVMAAAVNLDIIAVVCLREDKTVRLRSEGFEGTDVVDLASLDAVKAEEGSSAALIRGVAAAITQRGGQVGGFDCYTTSDVLRGSGLSSSAAFEVCLAQIFNTEFNGGRFTAVALAQIGQYAENVYFGKPSGLMDQLACAVGSAVMIDFADVKKPVVQPCPLDLHAVGCKLVITDTKGSHANLTGEYAAIREEMEQVAAAFGKKVLREVEPAAFMQRIPALRAALGDRAVLRSIHFFEECRRVPLLAEAARTGNFEEYLCLVLESGASSFDYNQNAYCIGEPKEQGVPLGLALSQMILTGSGAWRLQGGGFAGTIQAYVPDALLAEYCASLEAVFGQGACHVLDIRADGAVRLEA